MAPPLTIDFGTTRLPMILQSESAECGLACLAMVVNFYGYRIDMATLRSRFSLSLKGVSLEQICHYAETLEFTTRPLRLEMEEIRLLKTPCILHWNLNHFVVLKKATRKEIQIYDPSSGKRRLSYEDASKYFTGVALELSPTLDFKPADLVRRISLASVIGKIHGLWKSLGLIFTMAIALEIFAIIAPMFNQWVVDEALVSNDQSLLRVLIVGFALMLVLQTTISIARGWTVMQLSTNLNLQWTANIFKHLLRLPLSWFEKRNLGDIVSRFGSIGFIQRTITTGSIEAVLDGLMSIITFGMMLLYSGNLSIIVIAAVVLYILLRIIAYSPLRRASEESLILSANEQSCFLETIRGVQAIKIFSQESQRRNRWVNYMIDSVNRSVRTQKFMLLFSVANTAIFGFEGLLVFGTGGQMILDKTLTVGMLFAFTSYAGQFTGRMASLVDKFFEFKMLSLHSGRLADIVLEKPEIDNQPIRSTSDLVPSIELTNVGFRYADSEPWVLQHINLKISPGESIALIGSSGCGKTTLIKIILGLLTPTEGEIRYGGIPLQQLGLQAYRKNLTAVMQDDQLLSGSLAENISFFSEKPDVAWMQACANLAAIHDDIMLMPMQYHTLVGDMGTALSGGQKQRILLARALYRKPSILVLDEATSHLDIKKERQVNQSIESLSITRICIAHRPQTIACAKRVVEINKGRIISDIHKNLNISYESAMSNSN